MTLSRPYLLRAIYEWLIDNNLTPYLLVDAEAEDVIIPFEHVQDGKIILNISPTAVELLGLDNDCVTFSARFSGKAMDIYVPITAVLALYSMENGKGMMFPEEDVDGETEELSENLTLNKSDTSSDNSKATQKKDKAVQKAKKERPAFLKVVK